MSPQKTHHSSRINIISTSSIEANSTADFSLTPWDLELLFVEYSQKGLLYLNPTPLQQSNSLIQHLKQSLARALHFFPPLTGRLATAASHDGAATCYSIECKQGEGGALFVHATIKDEEQLTVADILESDYVPEIVRSFFPLNGVRNYHGVSQPLLAVQVTELADGLFVGCSINHLLVDGTCFWHFFNSWAQISRNQNPISKLPNLDRDEVNLNLIGSKNIYINNEEHLNIINNNPDYNHHGQMPPPFNLKERVFLFTKETINKLKARANREIPESNGKISSLQALTAHVWRSIIRCRFNMKSGTDETTTFDIPMGARQRLNPPLPETYFGNAVFPGNTTLNVRNILENGTGWTAWEINKMVTANNDSDKVRELYCDWVKKPNFNEFCAPPRNFYILINSPRFDIYENDLGWGKPVAARSGAANIFDGRITIFRRVEEGGVEIEACLSPEILSALAEDAEFMQYVG